MIGYRAVLTIRIGMAFAICGTETIMIQTVLFAMARLTFALMFHFSISTNIVNIKSNFRKISVSFFPQIIAINIVIVVNS